MQRTQRIAIQYYNDSKHHEQEVELAMYLSIINSGEMF